MEMEFAYDVKWATFPTVSNAHRRPRRRHSKGNKSRMSHLDDNDGSIMASEFSRDVIDVTHFKR